MKFLADMGISLRTVTFLRDLGHDAVHRYEQGLGRLSDPDILPEARDEGRVLLTQDLGFGELMAASGAAKTPLHSARRSDLAFLLWKLPLQGRGEASTTSRASHSCTWTRDTNVSQFSSCFTSGVWKAAISRRCLPKRK